MSDLQMEFSSLSIQHWLNYEFLTWRWFVKLFILLFFLILGCKLIDRRRTLEIVTYGLLMSLISLTLDVAGIGFAFWEYPVRLLPLWFAEIHDLVVIPVIYMLIYQYFAGWKLYVAISAIMAVIASFVMEPIFVILNFYKLITWKHYYSLPLFFAIAVLCKYVADKLKDNYRPDLI